MIGADATGRRLLFPKVLPKIPVVSGLADHEKKRRIAVRCLEMEETLENQGHSQSEIETKVASFRALLLHQLNSVNNNTAENNENDESDDMDKTDKNDIEEDKKTIVKNKTGRYDGSDDDHKPREKRKESKKKKKRRKESKTRKKKKERRRRCSSPTYSDYEPENPYLRNKRRKLESEKDTKAGNSSNVGLSSKKEKKKKKRKERSQSVSRSRSRSRSRKSRYDDRKKKKKKNRKSSAHRSSSNPARCSKEKINSSKINASTKDELNGISNEIQDSNKNEAKSHEIQDQNVAQEEDRKSQLIVDGKDDQCNLEKSDDGVIDDNHDNIIEDEECGKIVFSRIEDIPTQQENPKFISNFNNETLEEASSNSNNHTKLKFEISFPNKKNNLATKPSSTFAELSNRLGPTVNLNHRKLAPAPSANSKTTVNGSKDDVGSNISPKEESKLEAVVENGFEFDLQSANTVAEDMDLDDDDEDQDEIQAANEEDDDVVYLKTSKSRSKSRSYSRSRSRSRSYSYSRSRSRSYSYSSYSRSRSRSHRYSYSRSRSRSYSYSSYSSRSRSRSRSPSIPRRRGSPSFLDRRRITSARKRPIPYHRPTPSPSSSDTESSDDDSRSPSRDKKK